MRNEDPYFFQNFVHALSRVHQYVKCIERSGVGWYGPRFKFPLIWLSVYKYQHPYATNDQLWEMELVIARGYKAPNEEIAGAYDFSKLHAQHVAN